MSYEYSAFVRYNDPDDPLRLKNLSETPTVTAYEGGDGDSIAGASIANITTGIYKVKVTHTALEPVLFKVIPHNDDKDDFPDEALLAEEVRFVLDDGVTLASSEDAKLDAVSDRVIDFISKPTPDIMVIDAGTIGAVGKYVYAGKSGGYPKYEKGDYKIYNQSDIWYLDYETTTLYHSLDGVDTPDLINTWLKDAGDTPYPVITPLDKPLYVRLSDIMSEVLGIDINIQALKGFGWTDETLVALMEAIDAIDPGGGGGLDAAGVRSAIGLATANLDTQLSGIKTDTGNVSTRLTATRAGYLDKLNVAGNLANTTNAGDFKADVTGLAKTTDLSGLAEKTDIPSDYAKANALTTVDGKADAIKAKTDNLPASPAPAGEYTSALADIQTDLDNPSQYKADVSGLATSSSLSTVGSNVSAIKGKTDNLPATPAAKGDKMLLDTNALDANAVKSDAVTKLQNGLALEATLTAIKGAGWSAETLKAIKDAVDSIDSGLDAAGIRTAIGLATANLDIQLSAIQSDLDNPSQYKADVSTLAKTTDLSGLAEKTDIPSDYAKASALATVDGKVDGIKTKTDNLPNSPAATGDAMTLTSAYDNAKADVLTPLATVDGKADAIKAKTDKIPNMPAEAGEYTSALTDIQTDLDNPNQYKADVSGLALEATLTAIKGANWTDETLVTIKDIVDNISSGVLTAAGIRTAIGLASNNLDAQLSAIQSDLDDPSQYKADVSGLATSGALTTVDGKVNAIKAKTDNLPVSPAATGDKMLLDADALDATAIKADAVAKLQDGLALESTLSEIKGVGWTDETLKAIKDATGGGGLDAQGVRDAVGLANANLDTQLEAIQDDLDDPNQYKADVSGLATSATLSSVDGKVDSIKAATDKIPNTPAVAGEYDGALAAIQDDLDDPDQYKADVSAIVNILEDIKGAGWTDETLEAIADAITNVPGGEGVLEALESIRSELRQYSAVRRHLKCDRLEIKRATDATIEVFGVGDLTGRSSLYFTVKYMKDKDTAADMHSVIQIEETAGLLYINQVEADTPANGSIVVSDALAGTMTIKLSAAETDKLTPNESYVYDIKMDNDVMAEGKLLISTAVTRTVT